MLRDYQTQALTALREARQAAPDVTRLAIEMATGLGKTITFAAELDEWLTTWRPCSAFRALVLVHTDELIRQAVDKITFVTKGRWTIGVVKAGRNEVDADIVVASVQTLIQPGRKEQIRDVGKIIVDEAHHAVAPSYMDILEYYGAMDAFPDTESCEVCEHRKIRHITASNLATMIPCVDCKECTGFQRAGRPIIPTTGYTATLARTDGQGLGRVWQDLAFSRNLPWAIRKGWLIDLVPYTITIPGLDPGASDTVLDASLADSIAPEAVVSAWLEKTLVVSGTDLTDGALPLYEARPSTVLFAPLVRSAQAFADEFNAAGVKAEVVSGSHGDEHNRAVLARYEAGTTTVVCNAMKLTEGWDSPRTMCVIVARPTQSVPLFVQMIGRGLRPWLDASAPPREDQRCVLLCVQGTTTTVATVADLSDKIGEVRDGQSFLAMEDEWDIGRDIEPDEDNAYRGPVRVEQWDAIVQASSKAWKYTSGGVPFLPTDKFDRGYVYIVQTVAGWEIWSRMHVAGRRSHNVKLSTAPDLELAMGLAEDEAQERGGDIGALLADKTRPWRKAVPSEAMVAEARRLLGEAEIQKILNSKASGKAGKLSDLIGTVKASRFLDPNIDKIKERAKA
jgi:superfamily II DNA or RNA helicase